MKPITVYAVVRKNEGRAWIDTGTVSLTRETSESEAKETDEEIPMWAKDNPVVGVAVCELTVRESINA